MVQRFFEISPMLVKNQIKSKKKNSVTGTDNQHQMLNQNICNWNEIWGLKIEK